MNKHERRPSREAPLDICGSDPKPSTYRSGAGNNSEESDWQEGTIKFFNEAKGYGFISTSAGKPDAFLHAKDLERSGINASGVRDGMACRFTTVPARQAGKGPQVRQFQIRD